MFVVFRLFKSIDQLVENYKIKDKIGPVAEQSNSSGYLVSEGLDGRLFTILSYVEEFFPYDNTVSVHFYTPYKKNSFYSTKSTLISFFLVSSLSGCKKNNFTAYIEGDSPTIDVNKS